MTAQQLIARLGLIRHPEGGWFRETYRSPEQIQARALPDRYHGSRVFSTAIYFLLEYGDISALHRIKSDELWHFYAGTSLLIHTLSPDGAYQALHLGCHAAEGEQFQAVVPAGHWFGAELKDSGYALVGCTVAPGFDFADFEMAGREELLTRYPEQAGLLRRMTRQSSPGAASE